MAVFWPNNLKVAAFQTEWPKKNKWLKFADLVKTTIYIGHIVILLGQIFICVQNKKDILPVKDNKKHETKS